MAWWWLSFADPDLPKGKQFLGVCVVDADDVADALKTAHAAGCNPGGEVQAFDVTEAAEDPAFKRLPKYRLLSREEIETPPPTEPVES